MNSREEPWKSETKNLLLVGQFDSFAFAPQRLTREFPGYGQFTITACSQTEFLQHCQSAQARPPSESHSSDEALLVAITATDISLDKAALNGRKIFVIACNEKSYANLFIPQAHSFNALVSAIKVGYEYLFNRRQLEAMSRDIVSVSQERKDLCDIGIALSAEKNLDRLLTLVLSEGRKLGNCEAVSLYLLTAEGKETPELLFKLTQNSKIDFDFKEKRFPLTNQSLAGYVALTGEILNISDAYQISSDQPYQFDKSFDIATGYRTKELLVIPMRNHNWKVIGVLQFINHRDPVAHCSDNLGFTLERQELLMSLASQAAVAIDNSQLLENIQTLFEGFVAASVKAIESRDPVTSGHSFRVAELTTGLAISLDKSGSGLYRDTFFTDQQMREIRYASLLHDFGKVGVQENVLLKANKLQDDRYRILDLKIEWQKQVIQRKFFQSQLQQNESPANLDWQSSPAYQAMQKRLKQLDYFQKILYQANQPSILEEEIAVELRQLFDYQMDEAYPYGRSLLSAEDFLSLSVTRGSLTEQERLEIQSHVIHTEAFLAEIPWTEGLAKVPTIAASHHEKLDGSGYPHGRVGEDIPLPSRMMAVADIFDALTASDRPYKKAVQSDTALDILKQEAQNGKLCRTIVDIFIEAKVYQQCFD